LYRHAAPLWNFGGELCQATNKQPRSTAPQLDYWLEGKKQQEMSRVLPNYIAPHCLLVFVDQRLLRVGSLKKRFVPKETNDTVYLLLLFGFFLAAATNLVNGTERLLFRFFYECTFHAHGGLVVYNQFNVSILPLLLFFISSC
jgi:hypothetical protein